jgi:hypothetical protein
LADSATERSAFIVCYVMAKDVVNAVNIAAIEYGLADEVDNVTSTAEPLLYYIDIDILLK